MGLRAKVPVANRKQGAVSRVVRRRPDFGCEAAYEALVRGMLQASSRFPGYISAAVIPPHTKADQGEYQVVQRFASQADLDYWDNSAEREVWHERILPIAMRGADYHPVEGLEVWFPPSVATASGSPPRWKMTVVSWLGIFPTAAACLAGFGPVLGSWPYLLRMAFITAVVAFLMAYLVMPRLSVWMRWWIKT
jgi:antibiotic biosynthesis monooxygenase (ABM) superfamily enzyme